MPPRKRAATAPLIVDAETPGVGETVVRMAELLVAHGGFVHPDLIVRERGGNITLDGRDPASDDWFIRIPRSMLIPVDDVEWDESTAGIVPRSVSEEMTGDQRTMLELHAHLLTITGKLERYRAGHPRALAAGEPEVTDAVRAIRPNFNPDESIDAYLSTRTFLLRPEQQEGAATRVLMPILDLADHDDEGAPYRMVDGQLGARFAVDPSRGCTFVRYAARRDAIDLATIYGFFSAAQLTAVSAPLGFALDEDLALAIGRTPNRSEAPQWTWGPDGVEVDHLAFGFSRDTAMFTQLFHPLHTLLLARGFDASTCSRSAMQACRIVVGANLLALDRLATAADAAATRASTDASIACWRMVAEAAGHQAFVIESAGVLS